MVFCLSCEIELPIDALTRTVFAAILSLTKGGRQGRLDFFALKHEMFRRLIPFTR